jgi:hypothetical protein
MSTLLVKTTNPVSYQYHIGQEDQSAHLYSLLPWTIKSGTAALLVRRRGFVRAPSEHCQSGLSGSNSLVVFRETRGRRNCRSMKMAGENLGVKIDSIYEKALLVRPRLPLPDGIFELGANVLIASHAPTPAARNTCMITCTTCTFVTASTLPSSYCWASVPRKRRGVSLRDAELSE